jgi:hypothetical protein
MFKDHRKYVDYNGETREEDFYFNLDERDITKMELGTHGGLDKLIAKITAEKDLPKIIELFEQLIDASYGEKTADGKYFIKDPEKLKLFKSTQAYSDLYMQLATDDKFAANFVNHVVPKSMTDGKKPQDHKQPEKIANFNEKK